VARQALAAEVFDGALPARVVGPLVLPDVELHQVERVCLHLAEDPLDGGPEVIRREDVADAIAGTGGPLAILRRDLGGDEQLATGIRPDELAEEPVGVTVAVDEGGVEEGHAGIDGSLEDGHALPIIGAGPAAHPPHADAERAHRPACPPESSVLHHPAMVGGRDSPRGRDRAKGSVPDRRRLSDGCVPRPPRGAP
jgi:hypothetical protein